MNLDRLAVSSTAGTVVPGASVLFVLLPAKHGRVASVDELWASRSDDLYRLYGTWTARYAETETPYSDEIPTAMDDEAREAELGLLHVTAVCGASDSLTSLSKSYYRDQRFWKLIRWYNQTDWFDGALRQDMGPDESLPDGKMVAVPLLTGP